MTAARGFSRLAAARSQQQPDELLDEPKSIGDRDLLSIRRLILPTAAYLSLRIGAGAGGNVTSATSETTSSGN